MRLRAIHSLLCIVSIAAPGAQPRTEVSGASTGILEPSSATALMGAAQLAIGTKKIDMSTFSYSARDRFRGFENAWMTTERVRQTDGSDLWTDIICSTYSRGKIGPWDCSARQQRTVAVGAIDAARTFEFSLDDQMSGEQARQVISSVLNEIFRTEEIRVCDSKDRYPVQRNLLNSGDWRGADGHLTHSGDEFRLTLNFHSFRFSFDATAVPQARLNCIDAFEELE